MAKQRHSEAARTIARSVATSPEVHEEARQNADELLRAGNRLSLGGLISAGVGVVLWIVSRPQDNTCTLVLPIMLAAAYALMWLLMV